MKALSKAGMAHIPVVVGGIVPDQDEIKLKKAGVRHIFHPGASRAEIIGIVADLAKEARTAKEREVLA
jgi:methylmalonyl-CoA mutase cobalamin-binding domain/chain